MVESKYEMQVTLCAKSKGMDEPEEHKVNLEDKKIIVKNDINKEAHEIIKEAMWSRTKRKNILEKMHEMLLNQSRLKTDMIDTNKLEMPNYNEILANK